MLQVPLVGDATSVQGDIINSANVDLAIPVNTVGTYAGAMSGTGALVKSGTGETQSYWNKPLHWRYNSTVRGDER